MHGVHHDDPRRFFFGLTIGCLCAAVGCGPGGASQGPLDPQKVAELKRTTSDYMKGMKKQQGQIGVPGGHTGKR